MGTARRGAPFSDKEKESAPPLALKKFFFKKFFSLVFCRGLSGRLRVAGWPGLADLSDLSGRLSSRSGLRLVFLVWRGPGPTAPSKWGSRGVALAGSRGSALAGQGQSPCRVWGSAPVRKVKKFLKGSDYTKAPLVLSIARGQK